MIYGVSSLAGGELDGYRERMAHANAWRGLARAGGDALALALAFALSGLLAPSLSAAIIERAYIEAGPAETATRALVVAGLSLALLAGFLQRGHYGGRLPFWTETGHILGGTAFLLLVDGFLQFALKNDSSRLWLVNTWVLAAPLLLIGRRLARGVLEARGLWRIPAIVVGEGAAAAAAAEVLRADHALGYRVVHIVSLPDVKAGWDGSWLALCQRLGAEFVVLAVDPGDAAAHRDLLVRLSVDRVPFAYVMTLDGLPVAAFDSHTMVGHDVMLMVDGGNLTRPLSRVTKAVFDIVVGASVFVLALPVFACFAALVAGDGGPVFFSHRRLGRGGRSFPCLKFRTMMVDADTRLAELLAGDPAARAQWAEDRKLRPDPRVTPIGRFLRHTSLDELPQLINVLKGEMSLVGPRPIDAEEIARYGDEIAFYLRLRPGITGLWQVSGRSDITYPQRVRLDTWYVMNWSLWHDLVILAKTIPAVMRRTGAY